MNYLNEVLILSKKVKELELSLNLKQQETFLTTKQAAEMHGIPERFEAMFLY